MTRSEMLFSEAVKVIPGGVNSPVRAFGSVGETPRFIASAKGAHMTDVDGNTYLDFVGSWGPMILGHNHPAVLEAVLEACQEGLSFGAATEREVEMAELICSLVPSIEMVRMVNSGTEAVMSAIRAARGFTGRSKIVKFAGCYHGHSDSMLVKAGSGVMTGGIPDSAGVPEGCTRDTLTAVYNDLKSVEDLFAAFGSEIAAVIVEPVAANMGVVLPEKGFLEGLRKICDTYGSLLIFDEVITGFRLSLAGAQGYFGIRPDLTTFGKIIGGGMPVGAYGGRKDVMELIAPCGPVYQAGTLSGNPVAMAAGLAQLRLLRDTPDFYEDLNHTGDVFFEEMKKAITAWDQHGAQTLLLQKAIEYLRTPEVTHTGNEWKRRKDGSWEISNLVYKMTFQIVRCGNEWKLTWELSYTAPGLSQGYWGYTRSPRERIEYEGSKKYKTLEGAQRYIQSRFDQYGSCFETLSPPVPAEAKDLFCVNGQLLQGYSLMPPSPQKEPVTLETLLDCLEDGDLVVAPPEKDAAPEPEPLPEEEQPAVLVPKPASAQTPPEVKQEREPPPARAARPTAKKTPLRKRNMAMAR